MYVNLDIDVILLSSVEATCTQSIKCSILTDERKNKALRSHSNPDYDILYKCYRDYRSGGLTYG